MTSEDSFCGVIHWFVLRGQAIVVQYVVLGNPIILEKGLSLLIIDSILSIDVSHGVQ